MYVPIDFTLLKSSLSLDFAFIGVKTSLKMHCRWLYHFGIFATLALLEAVCATSTENVNHNNALRLPSTTDVLTRQKRQINKYNPNMTTPLLVAVETSMCKPSSPSGKNFCAINVQKLGYDHALIINPSDHTKFIYPGEDGTILFKEHQVAFLSCPGLNNTLRNVPGSLSSSNFTCTCGTAFDANDTVYDFNDLVCKRPPKYEILDKGFYGRENEYRKFEIGFFTDGEQHFLKVLDIHYDRSSTSTMYAKSVVSRFIAGRQKPAKQHRYDQTHCCERQRNRLDMDAIYNAKTQDRSFAAQLYCHDSEFHTRCSYLSESSAIIFNRGQLSSRSSFVYTAAGSATFVYLNTGPQWRPIKDGNWARIGDHVVDMAKGLRKDLIVYTGVYERLRLKDTGDGNREKMIFLYAGANNDKSIPIPLYFWKIIYEPVSKRGVVYVTVNDPYVEIGDEYHICEKPMFSKDGAQMPRMWKPKNIAKGYSYMCEVPDFMRSNAIIFNDFSASSVMDLLYLTRKSSNESLTIVDKLR